MRNGAWWFHPAVALGCPAILIAIAAYATPPETYGFYWKTGKFFGPQALLSVLACIAVFVFGTLVGQGHRRTPATGSEPADPWQARIPWDLVRKMFRLSFFLCLIGYTAWAAVAVKNGISLSLLLDAVTGQGGAVYALREEYLTTVPGVTTMTQFGIACLVLAVPLGVATGWKKVRWQVATVLFLALVRAVLHSERLALIELVVPLLISYLMLRPKWRPFQQRLIKLAPVLGGGLLFLVFSAFEYSRSWLGFYAAHESSFWRFAALRLVGYYSTALNNGALVVQSLASPLNAPYFTFSFAWKFPLVKDFVTSIFPVIPLSEAGYLDLLGSAANPEFNNPSGFFLPIADFGFTGGLLYWALCGLICGYLYRQFLNRSAVGLFLYPAIFTSLVEASRILYWSDGRFFPPMFLLVISVLFLFREPSRRHVVAAISSTKIIGRSQESPV